MPQMAPLNWLLLFIIFSVTFIFFNSLNYYSFTYKVKKDHLKPSSPSFNWKW
uniref:ATP synthase F0 subunit 8 n=1 Tax=Xoanodera maculata TaxID=583507 RepID=UPI001F12B662|nr:ATP synthase F0 subunit 8 [Xoanodera maculata]UKQ56292.1 ATP synthase F0 subunit 8 [Xoanodera maculata]